ncbi:hypothetical protein ACVBGC_32230 [Burkholderia stagnalis]
MDRISNEFEISAGGVVCRIDAGRVAAAMKAGVLLTGAVRPREPAWRRAALRAVGVSRSNRAQPGMPGRNRPANLSQSVAETGNFRLAVDAVDGKLG